ncbi:MAG TPA: amidase [Gemmatimonas sp.]|uniref:amidase n=1 Tax=Gemmatimonas sp. TaxID=1962908 RepID=UPI002ED77FCF
MRSDRSEREASSAIDRRRFMAAAGLTTLAAVTGVACAGDAPPSQGTAGTTPNASGDGQPSFAHNEATISSLQEQMQRGTLTSKALTEAYLARIAAVDASGPTLRSVLETNPDALAIAEERDVERKAGKVRGPLHGIPVLVKDNLDTADRMQTTAGSLALVGKPAQRDAHVVTRLREAGAVIIGKTNLSEWANFRSTRSSSGWSGRGGQVKHPYALDRNPCGSSSGTGTAIAANLATVGIGTETDGSIICPSSICGLVGLKPTVGLVSRTGIIPISATQDTAGPMTRTVSDAAALLQAIVGTDAQDAATSAAPATAPDYTAALVKGALKGARIGVGRNLAGFNGAADAAFNKAIDTLRAAGAIIVDPANVATVGKYDDAELQVLLYEFKDGLNRYLASRGDTVAHKTLSALIAYNREHADKEMPWFAQELFEQAEAKGTLDDAAYRSALELCRRFAREQGLDALFREHQLDALVAPSNGPSWVTDHVNGDKYSGGNSSVAAVSGYPSLTVPMGYVHELPLGISFIGLAWSEAKLLGYGYDFEQQTAARRAPKFLRTVE